MSNPAATAATPSAPVPDHVHYGDMDVTKVFGSVKELKPETANYSRAVVFTERMKIAFTGCRLKGTPKGLEVVFDPSTEEGKAIIETCNGIRRQIAAVVLNNKEAKQVLVTKTGLPIEMPDEELLECLMENQLNKCLYTISKDGKKGYIKTRAYNARGAAAADNPTDSPAGDAAVASNKRTDVKTNCSFYQLMDVRINEAGEEVAVEVINYETMTQERIDALHHVEIPGGLSVDEMTQRIVMGSYGHIAAGVNYANILGDGTMSCFPILDQVSFIPGTGSPNLNIPFSDDPEENCGYSYWHDVSMGEITHGDPFTKPREVVDDKGNRSTVEMKYITVNGGDGGRHNYLVRNCKLRFVSHDKVLGITKCALEVPNDLPFAKFEEDFHDCNLTLVAGNAEIAKNLLSANDMKKSIKERVKSMRLYSKMYRVPCSRTNKDGKAVPAKIPSTKIEWGKGLFVAKDPAGNPIKIDAGNVDAILCESRPMDVMLSNTFQVNMTKKSTQYSTRIDYARIDITAPVSSGFGRSAYAFAPRLPKK